MRVKRVGLKDHRQPASGRGDAGGILPVDADHARCHILQPRDQPQERGFPAAGGADEHGKLAILDGQIQRRNDRHIAEAFGHALQNDTSHVSRPYFTAPKVRPRTSCFWLNQPRIRIGAMAMVEAAESLA